MLLQALFFGGGGVGEREGVGGRGYVIAKHIIFKCFEKRKGQDGKK